MKNVCSFVRGWTFASAWIGGLMATCPMVAQGRTFELEAIKTESGCEVYFIADAVKPNAYIKPVRANWNGACIGGLAEGAGVFELVSKGENIEQLHKVRGNFHAGYPIGYWRMSFKSGFHSSVIQTTSWAYIADGRLVAFDDGLGLDLGEQALNAPTVVLPQRAPLRLSGAATLPLRMNTSSRSLLLASGPCMIFSKQIPECAAGKPAADAEVYYISEMLLDGDMSANGAARKQKLCPNPRSLVGCDATIEQAIGPNRDEVLAFIEQTKPGVDALLARMRTSLQNATALPTSTAAPAAKQVLPDLDKLGAGALYALADEYITRGDNVQARTVLRALIRRFPEHALAVAAARQLTNLP